MARDGQGAARTLSAEEVALRLRKRKRTVQQWAAERGCPHDSTPHPGGIRRLFNLDEVKEWAAGAGLWQDPRDTFGSGGGGGGADQAGRGQVPGESSREAGLDPAGAELRARVTSNLRRVCDLVEQTKGRQTPQNLASLSRALAQASAELRAVEKDSIERRERLGELVERADAEELLVEVTLMFVDDLERLQATLPQLIADTLSHEGDEIGVKVRDAVGVERRIGALVAEQVDDLRSRRFEAIENAKIGEELPAGEAA